MNRLAIAAVCAGALLRWSAAIITESNPIFPSHYYTDAVRVDKDAQALAAYWKDPHAALPNIDPSAKIYTSSIATVYSLFGRKPLIAKLLNGTLSTISIYLWYRIAATFLSPNAALLSLWLLALWPTHIFFGSQNFREAHILLFSSGTLFFFLKAISPPENRQAPPHSPHLYAAAGSACLLLTGLYRSYLMLTLAIVLMAALALSLAYLARGKKPWRYALLLAGWIILPFLLYLPSMKLLIGKTEITTETYAINIIPATRLPERPTKTVRPFSPAGITQFRKIRHSQDSLWAKKFTHRKIQTQIFPEAEFQTWGEVAAYLPKGTFYALFMPLPGLYPMDGKTGRWLSAFENTFLLILFLAAILFWATTPSRAVTPLALSAFFCIMAAAYGIFEFDLGAAARHRLQYFPSIFLLAAAFLSKRISWGAVHK